MALMFGFSPVVTILFAVIGFLGFPRFVLKRMAAARQKKVF